jgi:hypothetical protein
VKIETDRELERPAVKRRRQCGKSSLLCLTLLEYFLRKAGYDTFLDDLAYASMPNKFKVIEQGDTPYDWIVTLGNWQLIVSDTSADAEAHRAAEHAKVRRKWMREVGAQLARQ